MSSAPYEQLFIAISGLIGAGKTTLATALGEVMDMPCYYEPVTENSYLADFYADQKKYSFPLQIHLLNARFRQHQQIIWSGRGGVADRSIYEDKIFAKILLEQGMMDERDFNTYCDLFKNMSNFMRKPNVIVHLDVSPEESIERIKVRNRSCEAGISEEYMRALHKGYEEFIDDISRYIPVIRVNWSEFTDAETMARCIQTEYSKLRSIAEVSNPKDYSPIRLKSPKEPICKTIAKEDMPVANPLAEHNK